MAEGNDHSIVRTFEGGWGLFALDTQGKDYEENEGEGASEANGNIDVRCSFCQAMDSRCVKLSETLCEEGEARLGAPVTHACPEDFKKYFSNFAFYHGKKCSNPFGDHKAPVKARLTTITLEMYKNNRCLIPGKKVCRLCFQKYGDNLPQQQELQPHPEEQENEEWMGMDIGDEEGGDEDSQQSSHHDWSQDNALDNVNSAFGLFQESPVKRHKIGNQAYVDNKISTLGRKIRDALHLGSPEEEKDAKGFTDALRERFDRGDRDEKYRSLTSCPESWNAGKLMSIFNCSYTMASNALKLRASHGAGCCPGKKHGRMLPPEIKQQVQEFYLDQGVSRHLPGKKDVVMVRCPDGQKEERRKHLLLSNLNEAYCLFKRQNPDVSVGFSTFAALRPEEVVLPGDS